MAGRTDDATREFERDILPVSDNRVGPIIEWHGYASDFLRVFDLETLGLQEDYRLGHDFGRAGLPGSKRSSGRPAISSGSIPLLSTRWRSATAWRGRSSRRFVKEGSRWTMAA